MKSHTDFKLKERMTDPDDVVRKPAKLEPARKSGKERHSLYGELEDDDDELDYRGKRESVLDYFDDEEEE